MPIYDDDETFCVDDPSPNDINWEQVQELEWVAAEAYSYPEGEERSWAMLQMLCDMYGDDLRVL